MVSLLRSRANRVMRSVIPAVVVCASLLVAGCRFPYSLNGGGLPSDIKSVAIIPFDNETASSELQHELNEALRSAFASKLGLRTGRRQDSSGRDSATGIVTFASECTPLPWHGRIDIAIL